MQYEACGYNESHKVTLYSTCIMTYCLHGYSSCYLKGISTLRTRIFFIFSNIIQYLTNHVRVIPLRNGITNTVTPILEKVVTLFQKIMLEVLRTVVKEENSQ